MEKHNTCIYTDNPEKARENAVSGMDAISISEEAISEAAFPISKNDAKNINVWIYKKKIFIKTNC